MTDLNNIGNGLKLLKYILKTDTKNKLWTKEALSNKVKTQPNIIKSKRK